MVLAAVQGTLRAASPRLAGGPSRPGHPHRGPHRVWQDTGRVPLVPRFPRPAGPRGSAPGRDSGPLPVPAEGPEQRCPEKPGAAPGRDRPSPRGHGFTRARGAGSGSNWRHAVCPAPGHGPQTAPHPGDDARVGVYLADLRTWPRDAAHGADGDRGRDPCRRRQQAGHASRLEPGTAGTPGQRDRTAACANRTVGHAEAGGGDRQALGGD